MLSGILIKVGIDIFDYRLLKQLKVLNKTDLALMILVFLLTVFVNLIFAVAVGVVVAVISHAVTAGKMTREERTCSMDISSENNVTVAKLKGPLYFGTSSNMAFKFARAEGKKVILDITGVNMLDVSGIYAFEDEIEVKRSLGAEVSLVARNDQELMSMREKIGAERVFSSLKDALKKA